MLSTLTRSRHKACLAAALILVSAGCGARATGNGEAAAAAPEKKADGVGCFGRILPVESTFFVSPNTTGGRASVVDRLMIKEGDEVMPGQIVATLSSRPYLEAAIREAESRVNVARQRLERASAPPLQEDVAEAKSEIARLQVQRDLAARDYGRNKPLFEKEYISKAQLDGLETRVREFDAQIAQARDRLNRIGKVRPEDVAVSEAELRSSEAELARAKQDLNSGVVRAPAKARVLRLIARPGEAVGPQGIAEFADTSRMEVVAEVYEADIARVHNGQTAVITSELLPGQLHGEVYRIGNQIERQDPIAVEPGAPSDARVFKVRIRVPDQSVLASRINGKVNLVIQP